MNYSITDMLDELDEMFGNLSIDVVEVEIDVQEDISSTVPEYTYAMHVYFNDRFNYSTSNVLIFEDNWTSIIDMYNDIIMWYDIEGKSLLIKLNEVKYPDDNADNIHRYFEENKKIGKELWNSVDAYFKTNNNWR